MNSHEPVSDFNACSAASTKFHHFAGGFLLPIPCIICDNNIVYVGDLYDLLDFLDNGGLNFRTVRFFHAYMKGNIVTIVVLDLKSGELLKRSHRLNNDTLPCDWVLVEENLFQSKSETQSN
jgi:hypothetical protein